MSTRPRKGDRHRLPGSPAPIPKPGRPRLKLALLLLLLLVAPTSLIYLPTISRRRPVMTPAVQPRQPAAPRYDERIADPKVLAEAPQPAGEPAIEPQAPERPAPAPSPAPTAAPRVAPPDRPASDPEVRPRGSSPVPVAERSDATSSGAARVPAPVVRSQPGARVPNPAAANPPASRPVATAEKAPAPSATGPGAPAAASPPPMTARRGEAPTKASPAPGPAAAIEPPVAPEGPAAVPESVTQPTPAGEPLAMRPEPARVEAAVVPGVQASAERASSPAGGPGGFLVMPTRIVFEGRSRSGEVTLVNTGSEPASYRITLTHMRMSESGEVREITSGRMPGELFADSLVRFSPRQVDLEPRASQTVRFQLRKPAELLPGEYRSHLLIRAIPPPRPADPQSGATAGSGSIRFQLTPVYSAAIPVIVRHGANAASVALVELRLDGGAAERPVLALQIRRGGERSVYGDLTVTHVPDAGAPRVIGRVRGLAVYTPNAFRWARIPLDVRPGERLPKGRLRVTYEDLSASRSQVAEASLAVQ
jgi:hypothetical protein